MNPAIDFGHEHPPSSIIIERVEPIIDCGRYPIKREVGDVLEVSADIFKDGHDKLVAFVLYRRASDDTWESVAMDHAGNDRWVASVPLVENTSYLYTIQALPDRFGTWRDEVTKKHAAGLNVDLELREGRALIDESRTFATAGEEQLGHLLASLDATSTADLKLDLLMSPATEQLMADHRSTRGMVQFPTELRVVVDRIRARYAAWYEMFPRSAGTKSGVSGTFDDVMTRLPEIAAMGFDVLYFPPIHPIGRINRKGKNNAVRGTVDDPGVPYAIGNELGGHDAIEPSLGTIEDFRRLVAEAGTFGIEIALDFAVNAAPDHPWATSHPEWFHVRPDGSIKYAENPPKRYEDIYPVNFESSDWPGLWHEVKRVFLFWVGEGVKTFRVDNPHTKPTIFWEWLIDEVHREHPDVIFLSEAFTRPNVMKSLAKAGFSQSYTYFTWRNFKQELIDYFTELTQTEVREYYRGNLFPTTPDILPVILQEGGRPAFKLRLLLAATLSSVYGMYSGYELCENTPIPGKEEFLNSEKYEYKVWDWDRPDNITSYVTLVNRIRRNQPALHEYDNLRFYPCDDADMICYGKSTRDGSGVLVVANLDPFGPHETRFQFEMGDYGLIPGEPFTVTELITGESFVWSSADQHVFLDPTWEPALVYAIAPSRRVDYIDPSG